MVSVFSLETASCGPQQLPDHTLPNSQDVPSEPPEGPNTRAELFGYIILHHRFPRPAPALADPVAFQLPPSDSPQTPPFTQHLPSKAIRGFSFSHRSLNLTSGLRICPQSLSRSPASVRGLQVRKTPASLSDVPSSNRPSCLQSE